MKTILIFIIVFLAAILIFEILLTLRTAKILSSSYCLDNTSRILHKKNCAKVDDIIPDQRLYFDDEEIKYLLSVRNCKVCGGAL